jgi:queuine tRNA-ribosyltransferase
VTLDQFEPIRVPGVESDRARTQALAERTLRWARRCRSIHSREDQLLFGITQGGGFSDLRRESAQRTTDLGFRAFAIGGLGVGEPPSLREELLDAALSPLPQNAPRHLMGIGMPEDLVGAVAQGLDLFDCVVPTRHARHGSVFTRTGTIQLRTAAFRDDPAPPDPDCDCRVCQRFSRAYLRHLLASKEMLGPRLLTYHNLAYFMSLLGEVRSAIAEERFEAWFKSWRSAYRSRGPRSATHSAA